MVILGDKGNILGIMLGIVVVIVFIFYNFGIEWYLSN